MAQRNDGYGEYRLCSECGNLEDVIPPEPIKMGRGMRLIGGNHTGMIGKGG